MSEKKTFECYQDEAIKIINKRKNGWVLSTLDWEDVAQHFLTRLWKKFHLYDQSKPFENWANTTISNAKKNLLRDNCYKFQRPCLGCACNLPGSRCKFTASQEQCNECPIFAKWEKKKKSLLDIKAAVSIENHIQTISNIQSDFIDIEHAKNIIDNKILEKLESHLEKRMYKLLFIKNKSSEDVGKILKLNKQSHSDVLGYSQIVTFKKKAVDLAKIVIHEEGLA